LVASAQRHFSNHEFDAAEADYAKILEHDQNNGLALANLATIELQENKLAQAEKHITAAVAQSPNDIYNLSTLGYLRFLQEKYDDALDVLSRAAKLDPNNPDVQNYLGVTLSHKGLRKQAEAALRKAIEINPNFAAAHNNLAVVYLNQTPPSPYLARWHYQKAIAAGQPRNPDFEKLLADQGTPVEAP
jgi:Flp pilus assembly protein TadD